jgi:Ca2+-binding EF-hand superfamily protein/ABC-type multidrug transport system fused ATPase/permease subunit
MMVRRSGNRDKDGKKIKKKKKKYDFAGLELEDENPPEEPHMDFDIWNDPEEYDEGTWRRTYLNGTWWIGKHITTQDWFSNFILFCIIVAGVMVGIMTYKVMETNVAVVCVDEIISTIFALEVVLKMVAEGFAPSRYFTASEWKWNVFDFLICLIGYATSKKWPFQETHELRMNSTAEDDSGGGGGGSVKLLRLMRLARVSKLVRRIPELQTIVMGLVGGLKSIGYILLLMFMLFYLYAIMAIDTFGANDPFHFGSIVGALVTLFRCSTLEDWSDVMYIAYYGCDKFDSQYVYEREWTKENRQFWCDHRNASPSPAVAVLFFVSFTIVAAFVLLSLFIGAITMSMSESMEKQEEEHLEELARQKYLKTKRKEKRKREEEAELARRIASGEKVRMSNIKNSTDAMGYMAREQTEEDEVVVKADAPLLVRAMYVAKRIGVKVMHVFNPPDHLWIDMLARAFNGEELTGDQQVTNPYTGVSEAYFNLALVCKRIAETEKFNNLITGTICVAGILVGVQTYRTLEDNAAILFINQVILWIFVSEVVVKMVGEAFAPWRYFESNWNTFDFVIVVASFAMDGQGNLLPMLRLLRLFRVLKVLKAFPALAVIVNAMIVGMSSIGYIGLMLFITFYVFAILGMILFKENDPWHFGTLHISMLTLFRCATLEDWTDVMYINIYGCDQWGYEEFPALCRTPVKGGYVATIYFFLFTVMAAFIQFTLFIGVVTTSMESAQDKADKEKEMIVRLGQVQRANELTDGMMRLYDKVFTRMDVDGSGTLSETELIDALHSVGRMVDAETVEVWVEQSLTHWDDDNEEFDYSCFVAFMMSCRRSFNRQTRSARRIQREFHVFRARPREDKDARRAAVIASRPPGSPAGSPAGSPKQQDQDQEEQQQQEQQQEEQQQHQDQKQEQQEEVEV